MRTARIEDISDFVRDGTHGSPVRTETGIPVLSAQNVKDGTLSFETDRYTSAAEHEAFDKRLPLKTGDLLLTIVGTIGRAAVLTEVRPLVFQRSVAVIRPKLGAMLPRFLFHASQTRQFQSQLLRSSNQSSQAGVYLGKLKEVRVPLPTLPQQRRIAEVLDRAEALRAKRRAALAQLGILTQSIFLDMFGDPASNPNHWKVEPMRSLFSIKHGFAFKSEYFAVTGVFVLLTPGNFYESGGYRERGDKQKHYVGPIPEGYILKANDLLIAMTEQAPGLLGSPILIPESNKFLHNQRLGLVTLKPCVVQLFSFHLFNSPFVRKQIRASATGTKVKHTSPEKILAIKVPLPPLELQREFARKVAALETLRTEERASLAELHALFLTLQHRAFTGEL